MSTTIVKFQLRRDTAANWETSTIPLQEGEPGFDTTKQILRIGPTGGAIWSAISDDNTFYPRQYHNVTVASGVYPLVTNNRTQVLNVFLAPGGNSLNTPLDILDSQPHRTKTLEVPVMNPGETWRVDCQCYCDFIIGSNGVGTGNRALLLLVGPGVFDIDLWDTPGPAGVITTPGTRITSIKKAGFRILNFPADISRAAIPGDIVVSYGGGPGDTGSLIFYIQSLLFTRLS